MIGFCCCCCGGGGTGTVVGIGIGIGRNCCDGSSRNGPFHGFLLFHQQRIPWAVDERVPHLHDALAPHGHGALLFLPEQHGTRLGRHGEVRELRSQVPRVDGVPQPRRVLLRVGRVRGRRATEFQVQSMRQYRPRVNAPARRRRRRRRRRRCPHSDSAFGTFHRFA